MIPDLESLEMAISNRSCPGLNEANILAAENISICENFLSASAEKKDVMTMTGKKKVYVHELIDHMTKMSTNIQGINDYLDGYMRLLNNNKRMSIYFTIFGAFLISQGLIGNLSIEYYMTLPICAVLMILNIKFSVGQFQSVWGILLFGCFLTLSDNIDKNDQKTKNLRGTTYLLFGFMFLFKVFLNRYFIFSESVRECINIVRETMNSHHLNSESIEKASLALKNNEYATYKEIFPRVGLMYQYMSRYAYLNIFLGYRHHYNISTYPDIVRKISRTCGDLNKIKLN
ncbi:MAG: hypothetical protein Hyperionvirus1_62 [Hyperionvirus sp.]|uniref:Uncharacterized protein n=1 Tax=Hyperionvirus sp. TaxID=2487770 RepID=A0A3G5A9H3_9VIRU|nr:MAG: hypothetical protein Hyperionvirus1_62 [Hyperionvirus sp.]